MQDSQMPDPDLLSAAQSTLPPVDAAPAPSAGQLLRQAREAAHMHRASLAGVLKVPVKKIEALENDDWQSLPDLAFTRALASSICRQLKIDAHPVLALLPSMRQQAPQAPATLAEDKALAAARQKLSIAPHPRRKAGIFWATAGLFVVGAATAAWWWQGQSQKQAQLVDATKMHVGSTAAASLSALPQLPAHTLQPAIGSAAAQPSDLAASAALAVATDVPATALTASALVSAAASGTAAPTTPTLVATTTAAAGKTALLELQATGSSWVEVRDAQHQVQLKRLLQAGERVQLQGIPPYRIWAGRAETLQVRWQGQLVDAFQGKTGSLRAQIPLPQATSVATPAAAIAR